MDKRHNSEVSPSLATHSQGWHGKVQSSHVGGHIGQVNPGDQGTLQSSLGKAGPVDIERPVVMCRTNQRTPLP